jgi:5-carboxyvanillate decarboxylase
MTTPYLRIATEEACAPPELLERYRKMLNDGSYPDPGFHSLLGFYMTSTEPRVRRVFERMADLDSLRIGDMDATGVARQILSITAPGVQVFDTDAGAAMARLCNDFMADGVRRHPQRFSGLAAIAPQNPAEAARELERAVKTLGLKGGLINSHTHGEYLDDEKYWEIFEAAEALNVPLYIHPTAPPPSMIGPFLERGLDGAIYGFAAETGLHLLRIIVSGALDRFPKLQIVAGHLGEGLPYWFFRIDFMHGRMVAANRYASVKKLQRRPSDYIRENMYFTSSGMSWAPPILYAQSVMGVDRIMYAMDYPYQFVPEEVQVTDKLSIGAGDLKKFYQSNAERVFRI